MHNAWQCLFSLTLSLLTVPTGSLEFVVDTDRVRSNAATLPFGASILSTTSTSTSTTDTMNLFFPWVYKIFHYVQ